MNNTLKRTIFALLLLCIQQAQSLRCYGCMSNVSFADCSEKAVELDCNKMDPELVNGTFACAKGSGVSPQGNVFMKTCIPDMSETTFCAQLSEEAAGGKVEVCKVCKDKDLCNTGSGLVLTGALLLLTVCLMLGA
ncbi:uncharacterized protein LOC126559395 [Anopheles maculipalpis]|uniref:uncharacterized protein LOC126559395 n=1 Tax=Anopheles maculipalpis TaxID=1496333 RepID=UPI002159B1E5|nr:uncharacterized protein LOC126559395 [Anopheles maculipalpis]